jgi:hypothetical protein
MPVTTTRQGCRARNCGEDMQGIRRASLFG